MQRNEYKEDRPQVPIKTYEWEEVRRSRLRGGYPWTHFMEQSSKEDLCSDELLGIANDQPLTVVAIPIEPILDGAHMESPVQSSNVMPMMEHSQHSNKQFDELFAQQNPSNTDVSVENLSDCADMDEGAIVQRPPGLAVSKYTPDVSGMDACRARSEEPQKLKRKLSVGSSYSRASLSKNKLQGFLSYAKDKMSTWSLKSVRKKKKPTPATDTTGSLKRTNTILRSKLAKEFMDPVYIHIPLKLPEGETDEFSYLKDLSETEIEALRLQKEQAIDEPQPAVEVVMDTAEPITIVDAPTQQDGLEDDLIAVEVLHAEDIDLDDNQTQIITIDQREDGKDIIVVNQNPVDITDEDVAIIIVQSDDSTCGSSRNVSRSSSQRLSKKPRARSAEPDRRRRPSIDSSHSNKSLPKLNWMQKTLQVSRSKLKASFSSLFSGDGDKPQKSKATPETPTQQTQSQISSKSKPTHLSPNHALEPVYIHIPLKPPPGQTDEFSHLEPKEHENDNETTAIGTNQSNQLNGVDVTNSVIKLKNLAEDAIKQTTIPVKDEEMEINTNVEDTTTKGTELEKTSRDEEANIDEEDGLKVSYPDNENCSTKDGDVIMDEPHQPNIKKKVSFKRKSRDYQEVDLKLQSETVSVASEPPKPDTIKTEPTNKPDTNRYSQWSETSDQHEYEIVRPPSMEILAAPLNSTASIIITATPIPQPKSDHKYISPKSNSQDKLNKNAAPATIKSKSSEFFVKHSNSSSAKVSSEQTPRNSGGDESLSTQNKIKLSLKAQADRIQSKFQGLKSKRTSLASRPSLTIPKYNFSISKNRRLKSLFSRPVRPSSSVDPNTSSTSGGSAPRKSVISINSCNLLKRIKESSNSAKPKKVVEKSLKVTTVTTKTPDLNRTTVLDRWSGRDSIRVPLHSESSFEKPAENLEGCPPKPLMATTPSEHHRMQSQLATYDLNATPIHRDNIMYASNSSCDIRQRGVLEEINPDEFFLRRKGLSEDNIQNSLYLSSEIREAFKSPMGSLAVDSTSINGSNRSFPSESFERSPLHAYNEFESYAPRSKPYKPTRHKKKYRTNRRKASMDNKENSLDFSANDSGKSNEECSFSSETVGFPTVPPKRHKHLKCSTDSSSTLPIADMHCRAASMDYQRDHQPLSEPSPLNLPHQSTSSPVLGVSSSRSLVHEDNILIAGNSDYITDADVRAAASDDLHYAPIDKRIKKPPLPPKRTLCRQRTKRLDHDTGDIFATFPRHRTPIRPTRNYSTLGPSRPPRRKQSLNMTDEQKSTVDNKEITYIDLEDDVEQSTHVDRVANTMIGRPLPAPPRPPRKTKCSSSTVHLYEETVSTQTEPLPDNVVCDDIEQEPSDKVLTPSQNRSYTPVHHKVLITPTHLHHEETVTHASLLINPLHDHETNETSRTFGERVIPVERAREPPSSVLLAESSNALHLNEMHVDRLSVHELLAGRIIVSQIERANGRPSALVAARGELPPITAPCAADIDLQSVSEHLRAFLLENPSAAQEHHSEGDGPPTSSTADQGVVTSPPSDQQSCKTLSDQHLLEQHLAYLASQLVCACYRKANKALRRLIAQLTESVIKHTDPLQKHEHANVIVIAFLTFLICLMIWGWGRANTTVHHHHHWEYFNPPRDI